MHPNDVVNMRRATGVAANFISRFISSQVNELKRHDFIVCLEQLLASRLEDHWYPEDVRRGQAYRCIRLNPWSNKEALIETAVIVAGLTYSDIQLPLELTVWIDPDAVAYRFGENEGSHCTLVSFDDGEDQFETMNNTTSTPQTAIKGDVIREPSWVVKTSRTLYNNNNINQQYRCDALIHPFNGYVYK